MSTLEFNDLVNKLNPNIKLVSNYINNTTNCTFECNICHRQFKRTPKAFKKNSTCRWCSIKEKGKRHSLKIKGHKSSSKFTVEDLKLRCSNYNDYIIDYDTFIDRNHKIRVTHKVCDRTFNIVAKNFYNSPKCLCCIEDKRRQQISNSLTNSKKFQEYTSNRNNLCKDNFKDRVYSLVGDEYEFIDDYIDTHTLIRVKHIKCGHVYEVSPNHFISKGTRCPFCFRQSSNLELDIYNYVLSLTDTEIIRNDRKTIYPYELDIYIPNSNIAIEINGTLWHSIKYKDKKYHYEKSKACEEKGIRLIHIWEYEWNDERQRPILKNIIASSLGVTKRVYARKLVLEERPSSSMKQFFDTNNIQGFRGGKTAICLVDKNTEEVYMSYIVGHPYFSKGKYQWEVIRGATKLGYTVVGGASKIWSYFIKKYNPDNCVYYIDYNYFNGKSLTNINNMTFIKTQPSFKNYWIREGVVKSREPSRNKEIKELIQQGLVIPIYNAGTKVYLWTKD